MKKNNNNNNNNNNINNTNANTISSGTAPLAYRYRPSNPQKFVGYKQLLERHPCLLSRPLPSIILWGPPGCGKTSLGQILAKEAKQEFFSFSAVLGSVAELRKLMEDVQLYLQWENPAVIFIDEIHRFNKAQQDALLPAVEAGNFTLIGATTENPRYVINNALLSRLQLVELPLLTPEQLLQILKDILQQQLQHLRPQIQQQMQLPQPAKVDNAATVCQLLLDNNQNFLELLAHHSEGDARRALNHLEIILKNAQNSKNILTTDDPPQLSTNILGNLIRQNNRLYDRDQHRHYEVISAFIKSLRGSDPHAALLWLAIMLDGGEDPLFIARRLVIFASEDIGNADPMALLLATATLTAVKQVGMPEAQISLAQAVTYLASTLKSNSYWKALDAAQKFVSARSTIEVPAHLKNGSKHYLYPHSYPGNFVPQSYCSIPIPKFYQPSDAGREKFLQERLNQLWGECVKDKRDRDKDYEQQ
ncbi:MAG: replication-associated recombination protein A [Oligoflexia bacterium]|nr:replication-associated recombination protein A [Oligoflexia bacterium]